MAGTTTATKTTRRRRLLLQRSNDHYRQVGITALPLSGDDDDDGAPRRQFRMDLPVTLGRTHLAGWWWRSCRICREDSQTTPTKNKNYWKPSRFCERYCRPVAQQVDRLSKSALRVGVHGELENCALHSELIQIQSGEMEGENDAKGAYKRVTIGEQGGTPWMVFQFQFLQNEPENKRTSAAVQRSWTPTTPDAKERANRKRKHATTSATPQAKAPAKSPRDWYHTVESPASVMSSNSSWIFPVTEAARRIRQAGNRKRPRALKFPEERQQYSNSATGNRHMETMANNRDSLDSARERNPQGKKAVSRHEQQNGQTLKDNGNEEKAEKTVAGGAASTNSTPRGTCKPDFEIHNDSQAFGCDHETMLTEESSANRRSPPPSNRNQDEIPTPRKANQSGFRSNKCVPGDRAPATIQHLFDPNPAARRKLLAPNTHSATSRRPAEEVIVTKQSLPTQSTLSDRSRCTNTMRSTDNYWIGGQLEIRFGRNLRIGRSSTSDSKKENTLGNKKPDGAMNLSLCQQAIDTPMVPSFDKESAGLRLSDKKNRASQSSNGSNALDPSKVSPKAAIKDSNEKSGGRKVGSDLERSSADFKIQSRGGEGGVPTNGVTKNDEPERIERLAPLQPAVRMGSSPAGEARKKVTARTNELIQPSQKFECPSSKIKDWSCQGVTDQVKGQAASCSVFQASQRQENSGDSSEGDEKGSSGLSLSKSPVFHLQQDSQNVTSQSDERSLPASGNNQENLSPEKSSFALRSEGVPAGMAAKLPSFRMMNVEETGSRCSSSQRSPLSKQDAHQLKLPCSQQSANEAPPILNKASFLLDMGSQSLSSNSTIDGESCLQAGSQPAENQTENQDPDESSEDSSVLSLAFCEKGPSTQTSLILHGSARTQEQIRNSTQPLNTGHKDHQLEHWENLQLAGAGTSKASRALINMVVEMNKGRSKGAAFWLPSLLDGR